MFIADFSQQMTTSYSITNTCTFIHNIYMKKDIDIKKTFKKLTETPRWHLESFVNWIHLSLEDLTTHVLTHDIIHAMNSVKSFHFSMLNTSYSGVNKSDILPFIDRNTWHCNNNFWVILSNCNKDFLFESFRLRFSVNYYLCTCLNYYL